MIGRLFALSVKGFAAIARRPRSFEVRDGLHFSRPAVGLALFFRCGQRGYFATSALAMISRCSSLVPPPTIKSGASR